MKKRITHNPKWIGGGVAGGGEKRIGAIITQIGKSKRKGPRKGRCHKKSTTCLGRMASHICEKRETKKQRWGNSQR